MTTTLDRAEINRRNSTRSTGPRTPLGKSRSKFNALKHGMSAATPVLPGEDPEAYRHRLVAWAEALQPDDVVEQFLVEQAATASWKIERADRVEAARLAVAVRGADVERRAGRRAEADRLGRLLLGGDDRAPDPDLARRDLGILDPGATARAEADGRALFRSTLDRLEAIAEGCAWLLGRWAELRAALERGRDWEEGQLVEALRLSGRQPLDLTPAEWDRHRRSRYFVDLDEPEFGDDEAIDEERELERDAAIEAEDRRALTRQLVEVAPGDEAGARAAWLRVVERASGRLTELAAAHEAGWEAEAAERAEEVGLEIGPEEERLWRYQFGCGNSLRRAIDTLLKLRRGGQGRGPGAKEDRGAVPPSRRDEAVARAPLPDEAGAPVAAPPSAPDEAIAPAAAPPSVQPGAIAPANAQPSPQNEVSFHAAAKTSPRDQAGAQIVAQPSVPEQAGAPAVAPPSLQNETIASVRCGPPDPAAGATAGLPPGPGRAGDSRSARWRDPETSAEPPSRETGEDSRPDPREADESRVPRPRGVAAPDDRPPTGSEPVALEPAADRDARTATNEASGPSGESPIATNEPNRRNLAANPSCTTSSIGPFRPVQAPGAIVPCHPYRPD